MTESKWDARDRKRRKRMPVHGRSLESILASIKKRASLAQR